MGNKRLPKQAYIAKRQAAAWQLHIGGERLKPSEIAERLVRDGVIETTDESLESATRLVRADLAAYRAKHFIERAEDADPKVAFDDVDALEAELRDLRKERDRQLLIADGEPMELCARGMCALAVCENVTCEKLGGHKSYVGPGIGVTVTSTPQGPMISHKALWSAGVRQKASKDAAILIRQISELEVKLAEKRRAAAPASKDDEKGSAKDDLYRIVTSELPLNDLIAHNASGPEGKPN